MTIDKRPYEDVESDNLEGDDNDLSIDGGEEDLDVDKYLSQKIDFSKSKRAKHFAKFSQGPPSSNQYDPTKVAGVIKRVSLKNFMCHENFVLDFGPRLNFIIGHNGSGKSAILTGISICLGAKASETNRGSSLKDLIKEGANSSHIQVTLANEGDEAFEPGKYGSEIIIERVLRRDGSNAPYTLRSENGKKISQKKADLDAILDYHNIAVNNPMAFLSQDAARSFLTASTDEQKYKFFMRGTLMEEIIQNLKKSKEQVDSMDLKIIRMKEAVVRLKDDAREAKKLHDRLLSSKDLRERQRILHGKYFWMQADKAQSIVNEVKDSQIEIQSTIEQLDKYIKDYESKIANAEISKQDLAFKKEHAEGNVDETMSKLTAKKSELTALDRKIDGTVSKLEDTKKLIKENQKRVAELDRNIRIEEERIKERNGGSREVLQLDLKSLESRASEIEIEKRHIADSLASVDAKNKESYSDLEQQIDAKHDIIRNLQKYIREARNVKADELAPYPDNFKRAIYDMKKIKFQAPVLGPLGNLISIRPGFEDWAPFVEARISTNLNSFIVENFNDLRQLQNIFRKHSVRANIITRKPEEFNYSHGVPSSEFKTVLDSITFSNPAAKYALIDMAKIEKVVLIEDRIEAQRVLEADVRNVNMVISRIDKYSGQVSSTNRNGAFRVDPLYIDNNIPKLRPKDKSHNAQVMDTRLRTELSELHALEADRDQITENIKAEKAHFSARRKNLDIEARKVASQSYQIRQKLSDEADSGRLEAMNDEKEQIESETSLYSSTITEIQGEIQQLRAKYQQKGHEYDEIKDLAKAARLVMKEIDQKLLDFDGEKQLNITKLQHFEGSKKKRIEEAEAMTENLPAWEKNIEENILQAEESCQRGEADAISLESIEAVKEAIEKVTDQVERANEDLGKTAEEIVNDDELARKKYADAKAQFDNAVANKTYYHSSMNDRLKAFRESRVGTFFEADMDFKASLQFRNFTGNLDFDVNRNKLTMYVSTKNDKKPRHVDSLSGGEKSFSQISLLLATWKPMRSRIKGLDEFDVFMDQVNRKIGMRLMLEKLSKENSQTIFITPQDIGQIAELDERFVRIHRIRDPRAS